MAKTSRVKPTGKTAGKKAKKSPTRRSARREKDTVHEPPPLLNSTDVDDPALSTVDPSVSDIHYDV